MILLVQKSENCCNLDVHPKSQPRNVLKMFLVIQEIEPIVLINVFLYKKRSVLQYQMLEEALIENVFKHLFSLLNKFHKSFLL